MLPVKGDLVAIVKCNEEEVTVPFGWPSMNRQQTFDGHPWRVVEVSIPFVILEDEHEQIVVDIRRFSLQRVHRDYYKKFHTATRDHIRQSREFGEIVPTKKVRKRKRKPDPNACPRCGERMRQRLYRPGEGLWKLVCPHCSYETPDASNP